MILSANSITKYHNEKCILDQVSFTVEDQDKIALIGVNGTGKTTFLQIVADLCDYEGDIIRKSESRISFLPQTPKFDLNNSVIKQVEESLYPHKAEEFEMKSILNKLGITDYNQILNTMSGGQQKRVALAITLLKPCDLLILDEPTNHLDNEMIEWLEKFLIRYHGALIMVTHDRYFLDSITSKVWEINQSQIYEYMGNYSYYLDKKAEREENMLAQEKKRTNFLKKELEWVRAGVQARGTKSKGRLDRFYELRNQEKAKLQENINMVSLNSRLGKKTIELDNLGMSFGDKHLFSDFTYHFKQDDRVGILGINGSGKSTLLKIIAKELQPTQGNVIYGETIKLGYFKQGNDDMDESMKVIDYIKEVSNDLATNEGHFSAKQMLERFLFDAQLQYTAISRLSGGERRRLYLLKILMQAPNVLLLDEPTNDLDIATLCVLEDYLDQFQGIIITVSHDRYFLDRVCDSLFVFEKGNLRRHIGGYSTYISLDNEKMKESKDGAIRYAMQKQQQKQNQLFMSSKEKKELAEMEEVIASLESQIEQIDDEMNFNQDDFAKIDELSREREKLSNTLNEKSERWMELLDKEEQIQKAKNK